MQIGFTIPANIKINITIAFSSPLYSGFSTKIENIGIRQYKYKINGKNQYIFSILQYAKYSINWIILILLVFIINVISDQIIHGISTLINLFLKKSFVFYLSLYLKSVAPDNIINTGTAQKHITSNISAVFQARASV